VLYLCEDFQNVRFCCRWTTIELVYTVINRWSRIRVRDFICRCLHRQGTLFVRLIEKNGLAFIIVFYHLEKKILFRNETMSLKVNANIASGKLHIGGGLFPFFPFSHFLP
jgi:hypothetical protein